MIATAIIQRNGDFRIIGDKLGDLARRVGVIELSGGAKHDDMASPVIACNIGVHLAFIVVVVGNIDIDL